MEKQTGAKLCILAALAVLVFACTSPVTSGGRSQPVNIAAIEGAIPPVFGETPATAIAETGQYIGTVAWKPAVPGGFAASTAYTATITIKPKAGWTLNGVKANFFTIEGAAATNAANSGIVTAVFPATGSIPPETITIAAIGGINAPAYLGTPAAAIAETSQYTGTVAWKPAVLGSFAASTAYTATITLTPKTGYTFNGVAADFFKVAGAGATNAANSGTITATFPATGNAPPETVTIAAIGGISAPAYLGTPAIAIAETSQYTGVVAWLPDDDSFAPNTIYTATITLAAKSGYTFDGIAANFFEVAGASMVSNSADSGIVTAKFLATGNAPPTAVTFATIEGISAPAYRGTPATVIAETVQYIGVVTWLPDDDPFEPDIVYTATITLATKSGYTFDGVAADFFKVAGATTTNAADSGIVTATFPATGNAPITSAAITVTAPATGNTPVTTTPAAGTGYTCGAVSWSPEHSLFEPVTQYTATVTLTAAAGYTFTGLEAATINAQAATPANNTGTAVTLSYKFPATNAAAPTPITNAAISVTAPTTGSAPVITTPAAGTGYTCGTVSWSPEHSLFEPVTQYTATVTLTAAAGYTFTGLSTAKINSQTANVLANSGSSATFSYQFPATDPAAVVDAPITITTIQGVTAPALGETPAAAIAATAQYTGTIQWTPAVTGGFAAATAYTATITLAAKPGYTFGGVTANFFTVAGATATNAANSGIVTAKFPATGNAPITSAAITVTAPATGNTPVTTAPAASTGYTCGAVSWSPADGTFKPVTQYTATVTLTANTGYTFTGLAAATINGQAATLANNTGTAVTLSYKFPATDPAAVVNTPITNAAITVTAPVTGNAPVTTAPAGGAGYTCGAVSWSPAESPFLGSKQYTATVTLTAQTGHTFTGLASATINGQGANITNNTGTAVTLSYQFPATVKLTLNIANFSVSDNEKTYDGSGQGVTVSYSGTGINITTAGNITVYYSGSGGTTYTESETAPASAGTYDVRAETNGGTLYAAFAKTKVGTLTINKAAGPAAGVPALASKTPNSITVLTAPVSEGQPGIERAVSTESNKTASELTWGNMATFTGLSEGTEYYVYARTAGNNNYETGAVSVSAAIMTYIGYTVTTSENIGTDYRTSTMSVTFNFGKSIDSFGITAADITVSGAASKDTLPLTGSGAVRTLPVTANATGTAYISISSDAIDPLTKDITVYNLEPGTAGFSITFAQLTDINPTITSNITIYRASGARTATVTLGNPDDYDPGSISWRVQDTDVTGTGNTFVLNAANTAYNRIGEHFLTLSVKKNGAPYSKLISFTVSY